MGAVRERRWFCLDGMSLMIKIPAKLIWTLLWSLRFVLAIGMFAYGFFLSTVVIACFHNPLEWWGQLTSGIAGILAVVFYWKHTGA